MRTFSVIRERFLQQKLRPLNILNHLQEAAIQGFHADAG